MTGNPPYSEKELFQLIAQGDEPAFERLFHLYVPQIQPVILKMVKSEAVVKDIIQDIFLNIWVNRERLPAIESPSNWIFKIVYNRAYTWLEKQSVRDKAKVIIYQQQEGAASANLTEENVSFSETARLVQQAIAQLPPQTRRIYLLSRETGLKSSEIAEELNLSLSTVKNTLVNAGRAIKAYLAQHGIVLPLILLHFCHFP